MMRQILDTNIIVRFIVGGGGDEYDRALKIMDQIEKRAVHGEISILVINEILWVLKNFYSLDKRTFIPVLLRLLSMSNITCIEVSNRVVIDALLLMKEKNLDFTDAYLVQIGKKETVLTFDKRLKKLLR
ncbi:MAG TPA: PIN domain-containing protein [Patescibacteria group bacterium]|nr:PIN domain-containing protein [Patescibacteria group bacterium]